VLSDVSQTAHLSVGAEVTVEGTFSEWDYDVYLNPCSVANAPTATPAVTAITDVVKVKDIVAEFENNAVAATAKYQGQTFSVAGVVSKIDYDYRNNPYVALGSGAAFEFYAVRCVLSDVSQTAHLSVGAEVTVEGTFSEWDYDVYLNPCSVG
jgi:hypothetical protein